MLLFELDNYVSGNVVYNDTLNPKIYDEDGNMRPEVHQALMAVADNFIEDLDHPDLIIHDIILTGSSANFNWTKFSDIDLHLISDVDVFADPHMAEKYFKAAKNVWNNLHDVEIRGLDVEVYVEDNDEVNESLGRFSVLNNEWISKPVHNRPVFDEDAVNRKVRYLMKDIDHVMDSNDPAEIEHIKSKLWNMRKAGLVRAGEFSVENLAFKVLRNMGYAQKILDAIRSAEDDEMSVRESESKEGRIVVTYDVNWSDEPQTKTLYDVGQSDEEAIRAVQKLVGGRNHKVKRDMKIDEVESGPESAVGKTAHSWRGGVQQSGQIRKVKQIQGEWWGFAAFYNDSNPDTNSFRVKLDPKTWKPMEYNQVKGEWI